MRVLFLSLFLSASSAFAACEGTDLLSAMPAAERQAIHDRAKAAPYAEGNFWQATKGDMQITLVGTYHLNDPRHDPVVKELSPHIAAAQTVLVEAGPEEEAKLIAEMGRNPALIVLEDQTLPELMQPDDWEHLSDALRRRGIPAFLAAKMQPWYVSMMLAIPVCDLENLADQKGLDGAIIEVAKASSSRIAALEPYDTVFRIFTYLPQPDQIAMILSTLAIEDRAEDFSTTMADAYFRGESRVIWELMRSETAKLPGYTSERVDMEFALMEEALMSSRNRAWIPVIEEAAHSGPVFAAFGALHLSGQEGVLALLDSAGWTITPLALD